ncbi:hypothetical protein GTID1_13135 [Geobacillus thermodenitrificans]|uniref:hypothetical protein n=1 Tax=Geobacillus thermodenitrificans TaxID=33940 RepID=UPI000C05B2E5|nr:hypothetical protein [Geobacillus thermodenitrificans]ATO39060.1 hypothetical protein GTID1_13135 [Geobacillus thermodenitrificans]
MKAGNIEQFKHLSQFRDLKDLNNNMEAFLAEHKKDFTKSELICFKALLRFSVKVVGVSNISISKLLQAISERFGEVSESTFHRMKRKAIKLGILTVYTTHRKNGSQSSNVWVFNRFLNSQTIDTPISDTKQEKVAKNQENIVEQLTPQKTNNLLETNNLSNKRNENVSDNKYLVDKLDGSFTSSRVPVEFRDLVKCFYDDHKTIEELWKVIHIQTYYLSYYSLDDRISLAIDSFKQMVRNIKRGRKIRNIFGYFWGIVEKKLDEEYKSIICEVA